MLIIAHRIRASSLYYLAKTLKWIQPKTYNSIFFKPKIKKNCPFKSSASVVLFYYRQFQLTFDERVPKFVRNFRSSQPTWQFDNVVANEVMNFAANLGSSLRTSKQSLESIFSEAVSTARNSLIQQGKAVLITVWERVVDR